MHQVQLSVKPPDLDREIRRAVFVLQPYTCDLWDPVVIWLVCFFRSWIWQPWRRAGTGRSSAAAPTPATGCFGVSTGSVQDVASRIYVLD